MMNTKVKLLLAAILGSSATACVDNDSTLFIRQVQQLSVENECFIEADPSAPTLLRGVLDFSQRDTYNAGVLVGNQMVQRGDPDLLRAETGRIQLYEAEVEVFDYQQNSLSFFVQPIAGFVDVGAGSEPGYGVSGMTLVDPAAAQAIGAAGGGLVSRVKIFGETLGGLEVETGEWDFPITVCSDCTPVFRPESCDDELAIPCNVGQDLDEIDIRLLDPAHCCNQDPIPEDCP